MQMLGILSFRMLDGGSQQGGGQQLGSAAGHPATEVANRGEEEGVTSTPATALPVAAEPRGEGPARLAPLCAQLSLRLACLRCGGDGGGKAPSTHVCATCFHFSAVTPHFHHTALRCSDAARRFLSRLLAADLQGPEAALQPHGNDARGESRDHRSLYPSTSAVLKALLQDPWVAVHKVG